MRVQSRVDVNIPTLLETKPIDFYVQEIVDFAINTTDDSVEYSVYTIDANGSPEYYLAKKKVKAVGRMTRIHSI